MRDGYFPAIAGEVVERDRLGHRLGGSHLLSNSAKGKTAIRLRLLRCLSRGGGITSWD